ncbi:MAG TPA: hypothetical protein EYP57_02990 [Thermodesulfobacteriaceae bacterium]|nr:hypothetical protein [Thermodesulfobacteriaceae bacterium]
MHAAKGLEFSVVFWAGCEAGIIPWKDADMEEEEQLFYVGCTRAWEKLFLTCAGRRRLYGRLSTMVESPFISRIPEGLAGRTVVRKKKVQRRARQLSLF